MGMVSGMVELSHYMARRRGSSVVGGVLLVSWSVAHACRPLATSAAMVVAISQQSLLGKVKSGLIHCPFSTIGFWCRFRPLLM